jgi:hypothetical protein
VTAASFILLVIGTVGTVASAVFGYLAVAPILRRGRRESTATAPPYTSADHAPPAAGKITPRKVGSGDINVADVTEAAEHAVSGRTVYLGPLVLCVPLAIFALAGVKYLDTYTPWWIILVSSFVGLLATATEYTKNRIYALVLEVNFMWLIFYSFFFLEVASHMTSQSALPFYIVLYIAATLGNLALFVLTSFLKARYREQGISLLLVVFLGLLTAGFILETLGVINTSFSQGRLGALLTFAAVLVNARALLLAFTRKRETARGDLGRPTK